MQRGKMLRSVVIAAAVGTVLTAASGQAGAADMRIELATGGVTGVYYPAGGAICRMINRGRTEHGIRCSVAPTDGSIYNLDALRTEEFALAIAQSDIQGASYRGRRNFTEAGADAELRSLLSLHSEPLHILSRADAGIRTLQELDGRRVNIGNPESGQRGTVALILDHLGWTTETFSVAGELTSVDQSRALCDDRFDVLFFTAGIPNGSMKEAARLCDTRLVPLARTWVRSFVRRNPAYSRSVIPGGMYRGSDDDVLTIATRATLVTSTRLAPDVAYQVVRSIFERFEDFRILHPALTELEPREMVRSGLVAPLHEGAERYYREAGLR